MKLKKPVLLLFSGVMIWQSLAAQGVNYSVKEDDPYKYNFAASLVLFQTDWATKQSLMLGYALYTELSFKKLFTAELMIDRAYAEVFDWNYHFATNGISYLSTTNIPERYGHLELGGMWHLRDQVKEKQRKLVLAASTSYGSRYTTTTSTYILIPAQVRSIIGARAGLYRNVMVLSDRDNGTVTGSLPGMSGDAGVIADDGTEFGGAVNSFSSPFYGSKGITNMFVNGFYVGLCNSRYHNVTASVTGYGEKSTRVHDKIFADVIIAVPIIDDFQAINGKTYRVSGGNARGFETRPFGIRAGYDIVKFGGPVAMYARFEGGIKPGLAAHKGYILLSWGLTFRGKLNALAPQN